MGVGAGNCLISLPAAWHMNETVVVFIAEGWIIFSFVGIKTPQNNLCTAKQKEVETYKEKLVELSRGKYTWFQRQNGVCALCHPLGDMCALGKKCVQNILVAFALSSLSYFSL